MSDHKIADDIKNTVKEGIEKIERFRSRFHKSVNVMLGFFLFIFLLFVLIITASQTSTFRNALLDYIVSSLNESINGKITAGRLDGSLFTTIELRDVTLTDFKDTVASVELLSVRISPFRIFTRRIVVKDILLDGADLNLKQDSAGIYNIAKIFPSEEDTDTTKSEFPFIIQLEKLELRRINFSMSDERFTKRKPFYDTLNLADLKIDNLSLRLRSEIKLNSSEYELTIDDISFASNIRDFGMKQSSGKIRIDTNGVVIDNLNLTTIRSDLNLNLILADYNLLGDFNLEAFSAAPLYMGLTALPFNFDDLYAFVPAVDMLKGDLNAEILAKGSLNELEVRKLNLGYNRTSLLTSGRLYYLTDPDKMMFDAAIINSKLYEGDAALLLPEFEIPVIEYLNPVYIDTLTYKGSHLKFKTFSSLRLNNGALRSNFDMNIEGKEPDYSFKAEGRSINLKGLTDYPVQLNFNLKGEGKSFTPELMTAHISGNVYSALIGRQTYDKIDIETEIKDQNIVARLKGYAPADTFHASLKAFVPVEGEIFYSADIEYNGLRAENFIPDSAGFTSKLNVVFRAEGTGIDPEKINANVKLNLLRSEINNRPVQDIFAIIDLNSGDNSYKKIAINSSLLSASVEGKAVFTDVIAGLLSQTDSLMGLFNNLANKYFPEEIAQKVDEAGSNLKKKITPKGKTEVVPVIYPEFDLSYNIKQINLQPLAFLFDDLDMSFEGDITGSISQDTDSFSLAAKVSVPFFRMWVNDEINFVSEAEAELRYSVDNAESGINKYRSSLNVKAGRIYAGNEFNDIHLTSLLTEGKLTLTAGISGNAPRFSGGLKSVLDLSNNVLKFDIEDLEVSYNDYQIRNQQPMSIDFLKNSVRLNNINLTRGYTNLLANGMLQFDGYQNVDIFLSNFRGYDLSNAILDLPAQEAVDFDMNIQGSIKGSFNNPSIQFTVMADSVKYQNKNFGSLKSLFDYSNKLLRVDVRFIDLENTFANARLNLSGYLPIDLAYNTKGSRLPDNKRMQIRLLAKDFNLGAFGSTLPFLNDLRGTLNSDMTVAGTYNNLSKSGFLEVSNGYFVLQNNNLPYDANLKLKLEGDQLVIENLNITNAGRVKNKGSITGSGKIKIDGYEIDSMLFAFKGNLSVLSEESRAVLPAVYGDLFVETDGQLLFSYADGKSYLSAPFKVVEAALVFPPTQTAYSSSAENFIYKYVDRNPDKTRRDREIEDLLNTQRIRRKSVGSVQQLNADFDFRVGIEIKNEAVITFVFSQESNQNLTARLGGGLTIERRKGIQNIQGELTLEEGSNLSLIKTFNAEGNLRFESDITNPYLDITALYKDYYLPPDTSSTNVQEEEVAVKVILRGPLSDLSKNFTQMENNIAVYRGKTNIDNNTPSTEYDKADALWFILTGKFKNELTSQEKTKSTQFLGVNPTALAGSLLGGLLSAYLGDYVRSFEFRNVGAATKFNLSGKYKDLRYTVGGSTNVFQDFSSANVRIEYPLLQNFLIRVERKEANTQTNYSNEMINELGLKYRFEF